MTMSAYDLVLWEKEMKKQIQSHARVLYDHHPYGSEYDIIHAYSRDDEDRETPYNVHLLVCEKPHKSEEWKKVLSFAHHVDVAGGLTHLLESLRVALRWKLDKPRVVAPATERNDDVDNASKGNRGEEANDDGREKKRRRTRSRSRSRSRGRSRR